MHVILWAFFTVHRNKFDKEKPLTTAYVRVQKTRFFFINCIFEKSLLCDEGGQDD